MTRQRAARHYRASDVELRATVARDADYCGLCHRAYADGNVTMVGWAEGRLVVAGPCCSTTLDTIEAVGLFLAAHRPWLADDREWFERHPSRSHRVRRAFPGEPEARGYPAPSQAFAVVRQIEPGKRLVLILSGAIGEIDDYEPTARRLFEAALAELEGGRA